MVFTEAHTFKSPCPPGGIVLDETLPKTLDLNFIITLY